MTGFKLKVRLADGRTKLCGCGTRDRGRYDAMRQWVQSLKRGATRREDVLEAIVVRGVPLPLAYDHRHDLDAVLGMTRAKNIEPMVTRWHQEKSASRKGATSADKYLTQVRAFLPEGVPCLASRFTAPEIRRFLKELAVAEPTKNRYKAALSSFAEFLIDEGVLDRHPVLDVRGFAEGPGRVAFYEHDEALAILQRISDVECAAAFALAVSGGLEHQVITRLRRRDLDLAAGTVWADGGKTAWRRRTVRLLFPAFTPAIARVLEGKLPAAPVFSTLHDSRALLRAIADAAKAAELPRLTFHDQRHTHAVAALRAGYRPQLVAHQLGHSNTHLVWTRYGRYVVDERDYQLQSSESRSAASR